MDAVSQADEAKGALNDFCAATGTATEDAGQYKQVMENIYNANYGEGFEDIAAAMAEVRQQAGDLGADELEKMTTNALALRDTFDFDVAESTRAATQLINGGTYTVNDIVMPAGGSQVVWAKWHTPLEPTTLTIQVSVDGASTAKTSFIAKIVSLEENLPPDPLATDTNPHFSTPSLPSNPQKTSASWSVWSAKWHANWEWESNWDWEDGSHSSDCP